MRATPVRRLVSASAIAVLALWSGHAGAAVPTALLVEPGPLPGVPGQNITSIGNTAVNDVGGHSVNLGTSGVLGVKDVFWGNPAGNQPSGVPLVIQGTHGPWSQTNFEGFFGMGDGGEIAYSPTVTNTALGLTGLDSVWVGTTEVLTERDPLVNLSPLFSRFNSRPGMTTTGPFWHGGWTSTVGGNTQGYVLFHGWNAVPLLKSGDFVGVAEPIGATTGTAIGFDSRMSRHGTHWIAPVMLATASSTNRNAVVVDGTIPTIGGSLLRAASDVTSAIGGLPLAGEKWQNFDQLDIDEQGRIFFTGDTSLASTMDGIVFFDGQIVLREGSGVFHASGPLTLRGNANGYSNENGDWAVRWTGDFMNTTSTADDHDIIVFNWQVVLREGQAVDLTGDGIAEPNAILRSIGTGTSLTLGACAGDGTYVYFTGMVDVNGTTSTSDDLEGYFRLKVAEDLDAPAIDCPGTVTLSNAPGTCGAALVSVASASDGCDAAPVVTYAPLGPGDTFPVGTTTVTATATDANGNVATCAFDVVVQDVEAPVAAPLPAIAAGNDPGACGAVVSFSVSATDNCDVAPSVTYAPQGPGTTFPVGTTTVVATPADAAGNVGAPVAFDVVVADVEPPQVVSIEAATDCAWPPNHRLVTLGPGQGLDVVVVDNCGAATFALTACVSSEDDDGLGDGHTSGDCSVVDGVVRLRAERSGRGEGRTYAIGWQATDAAGNVATGSFALTVPHDRSGGACPRVTR